MKRKIDVEYWMISKGSVEDFNMSLVNYVSKGWGPSGELVATRVFDSSVIYSQMMKRNIQ